MPGVVRGKGRVRTYNLFKTAVTNAAPDTLPLLLVDSEGAVLPNHTVWEHLKSRDGWDQPLGAGADDAFLMVQLMEPWLLADRAALRKYFGPKLNEKAFAEWPELESVPKATVLHALEKATADCKTKYAKGPVAFEVLSSVEMRGTVDVSEATIDTAMARQGTSRPAVKYCRVVFCGRLPRSASRAAAGDPVLTLGMHKAAAPDGIAGLSRILAA